LLYLFSVGLLKDVDLVWLLFVLCKWLIYFNECNVMITLSYWWHCLNSVDKWWVIYTE
jgi:hypothetical protein